MGTHLAWLDLYQVDVHALLSEPVLQALKHLGLVARAATAHGLAFALRHAIPQHAMRCHSATCS